MNQQGKISIGDILAMKKRGEKIAMLTAYDFPLASIIDRVGVEIVLVGDSVANVVLGLERTTEVTMPEMLHHAKAVSRAVKRALIVGDMPFESYQVHEDESVKNAQRFIREAHCDAVKLEWFDHCLSVTKKIVAAKISVMGHIGLTPQTADQLGGFKVQGKDAQAARKLIDQAVSLEQAGCFSLVLECIPDRISELITKKISIPTIGIGAGVHCDGQVLVSHDMLGLFERFRPKFVKQYVHLNQLIEKAVNDFKQEVKQEVFPDPEHSYSIKKEELDKLLP